MYKSHGHVVVFMFIFVNLEVFLLYIHMYRHAFVVVSICADSVSLSGFNFFIGGKITILAVA